MEDKKKEYILHSHPRWNDTSVPEVIGYEEVTDEEKKHGREMILRHIEKTKGKENKTK